MKNCYVTVHDDDNDDDNDNNNVMKKKKRKEASLFSRAVNLLFPLIFHA